mmetsp:Transcript_4868/g.11027  ORF Transcript_4868/g.11027 Transcript_4868/m.11027 type:complete len:138 (-) Transcript_4868:229-642(-)
MACSKAPAAFLALLLRLQAAVGSIEDAAYGYECDRAIEMCALGCSPPVEMRDAEAYRCSSWECVLYCAKNQAGKECLRPWTDLCSQMARSPQGAGEECLVDCSGAFGLPRLGAAPWLPAALAAALLGPLGAAARHGA